MKRINKKSNSSILILSAALALAPALAFGADPMDSQFHSEVSNKVQQDHAADVKAGKVSHGGGHPASAGGPTLVGVAGSAAAGGTSGTKASPAQVKQAQKKKATPPPATHR